METELQRLATTDALTQSSNRRHFFECAEVLFAEARSSGSPLSFLLLDIDDFKKINDGHGHAQGDEALKAFAAACRLFLHLSCQSLFCRAEICYTDYKYGILHRNAACQCKRG